MNKLEQALFDQIKSALADSQHGQLSDAAAEELAVTLVAQGWKQ